MLLCPTCKNKPTPPGTHRGTCVAKASANCKAWTEDFALTMCDECCKETQRCAWCWGPIDGGWGIPMVPTDKDFCRVFERDNGKHVTGMNVDQQILFECQVDLYSGTSWMLDRTLSSREVSLFGWRMIRDPRSWRYAKLEIYVDLNAPAEQAKIVFTQQANGGWWWGPPPTGKPFEITVEIRR
jgi:hypothetical protein